mgnify:CR=1 FL=1
MTTQSNDDGIEIFVPLADGVIRPYMEFCGGGLPECEGHCPVPPILTEAYFIVELGADDKGWYPIHGGGGIARYALPAAHLEAQDAKLQTGRGARIVRVVETKQVVETIGE